MKLCSAFVRDQRGVAMVVALLTVLVMVLLTSALVVGSMTETFSAQTAEDSARAFLVADAAAARAIASLRLDPDWSRFDGPTNENRKRDAVGDPDCPGGVVDLLTQECMQDRPYPKYGPFVVSAAAPPDGGDDAACAARRVTNPGNPGAELPEGQSFGRYTVTVQEVIGPDRIKLRVVGRVGRAARGFEITVNRVTAADFVGYSSGTVDSTVRSGSGELTIHGSIYIRGDWAFKGNSKQLNPPPHDHQTYVCGGLYPVGNAHIGEQAGRGRQYYGQPMAAVHIAGGYDRERARIYANIIDNIVPDIRLGDVARAAKCIRGIEVQDAMPPINQENCESEFPRLWGKYTNHLSNNGTPVWITRRGNSQSEEIEYQLEYMQSPIEIKRGSGPQDLVEFAIPKRDRQQECLDSLPSGNDEQILTNCSVWGRWTEGHSTSSWWDVIFAAEEERSGQRRVRGQLIYLPASLLISEEVRYRVRVIEVDEDFGEDAPNSAASFFVVDYPIEDCVQSRQETRASLGIVAPFKADGEFPGGNLVGFLVNGCAYVWIQGGDQTVQSVMIVGGGSGRCNDSENVSDGRPGDLVTRGQLNFYGALIAKCLSLQNDERGRAYNVEWFHVQGLRDRVVNSLLGGFLRSAEGSAVVVTQWREVGF